MNNLAQAQVPVIRLDQAERDAKYFEYTSSANPIGAGLIPRVPYRVFPASLYADGPTRSVVLDLSKELGTGYQATGPGLRAHFLRVLAGETLNLNEQVTSQVLYVISGRGEALQGETLVSFGPGDFVALPGNGSVSIAAAEAATLYYVNDAPLLAYLGVAPAGPRFAPTHYPAERAERELAKVAADPHAAKRNRVSILLGNARFPQTRTVTHVMWAMLGVLPPGAIQKPHRHQSIALDFIVDAAPGTYTLVGTELDDKGAIVNPTRVDWEPGLAFVTPPGYWHAHFNESGAVGHVIPLQDAGLHTYLRSLDIRFAH